MTMARQDKGANHQALINRASNHDGGRDAKSNNAMGS